MTLSNPAPAAPDPVDVAIGVRIRARRDVRRITQAQLAAAVGVTFQQIQKYERGVNRVAAARLLQIAAALKTTASDLLGERLVGEINAGDPAPDAALALAAFSRIADVAVRDAALTLLESLSAAPAGTFRAPWRDAVIDTVQDAAARGLV